MSLRPTHRGYAYQDLMTAIRLVDVALGSAEVTVDAKSFAGDRFDDLTTNWFGKCRERIQLKHTDIDRALSRATFTADGRDLRLDLLADLIPNEPLGTTVHLVFREQEIDDELAAVLLQLVATDDPGPVLLGLPTTRHRFNESLLRTSKPWSELLAGVSDSDLERLCSSLIVETGAPRMSQDFRDPGPAEEILLRRVASELGAGHPPNQGRKAEDVALALVAAAHAARSGDAHVTKASLMPKLDLVADYGAVSAGNPVDPFTKVARAEIVSGLEGAVAAAAYSGASVIITGPPGLGKSWTCELLAQKLEDAGWTVARHHCWLGFDDARRPHRVLSDVVIGSLLGQLEESHPDSVARIRPRYSATAETLGAALSAIIDDDSDARIAVLVDGLDHVNRVSGVTRGSAITGDSDPASALVALLARVPLPPGAALVLVSQPGGHLQVLDGQVDDWLLPPMSRGDTKELLQRFGLVGGDDSDDFELHRHDEALVDRVAELSGGNALYATYLCRQALARPATVASADPLTLLANVPGVAGDLEAYYRYLYAGLEPSQRQVIQLLAVLDFAVSRDELAEIFPGNAALLGEALRVVAPVITDSAAIGGLSIHHESFAKFLLTQLDPSAVGVLRDAAAKWLKGRGFADLRSFRHLPGILSAAGRHDEVVALLSPDFVADAIATLQPPNSVRHVLGVIARSASEIDDWRALIRCVELARAAELFTHDRLPTSLLEYADVPVELMGAERVAATLLHRGRATVPPRWGIQLCAAADRGGAAVPWSVYQAALADDRDDTDYGREVGEAEFVADLRGRLRTMEGLEPGTAEIADIVHRLAGVFERGAPIRATSQMVCEVLGFDTAVAVANEIMDDGSRAQVLIELARISNPKEESQVLRQELAAAAMAADAGSVRRLDLLDLGVAPETIIGVTGLPAADQLIELTAAVLAELHIPSVAAVLAWVDAVNLVGSVDSQLLTPILGMLDGVGFFRAWLRFVVATAGLQTQRHLQELSPVEVSEAVVYALEQLAASSDHFSGQPRACDLFGIGDEIHRNFSRSLSLVQIEALPRAVAAMRLIGERTTTSGFGSAGEGPLTTLALVGLLMSLDPGLINVSLDLLSDVRETFSEAGGLYDEHARLELELARLRLLSNRREEAVDCWHRAAKFMSAYGFRKDITLFELLEPIPELASANPNSTLERLHRVQPLTEAVVFHTDGSETRQMPHEWWKRLCECDPASAAQMGAIERLEAPGYLSYRIDTAHEHLLQTQASLADPLVLSILRITAGVAACNAERDTALFLRLSAVHVNEPALDGTMAMLADAVLATYDDRDPEASAGERTPPPTQDLLDSAAYLGASCDPAWIRPMEENSASFVTDAVPTDRPIRPQLSEGPEGALEAVRGFLTRRYDVDADTPMWTNDSFVNAVGYRILAVHADHGAAAASDLLDQVADAFGRYDDATPLGDIAEGLARVGLSKIAARAYVLAFTRVRGWGGAVDFGGRDRLKSWKMAAQLDLDEALRTLRAEIARSVGGSSYGGYGVTQSVISALAAGGNSTTFAAAFECWDSAFEVITARLPLQEPLRYEYEPPPDEASQAGVDLSLAKLALSTIALPGRDQRRRALVAATALLDTRPKLAQEALAFVLLRSGEAGPTSWLLQALIESRSLSVCCEATLANALEALARCDHLSVRALARQAMTAAGLPTPLLPATAAVPELIAALRE